MRKFIVTLLAAVLLLSARSFGQTTNRLALIEKVIANLEAQKQKIQDEMKEGGIYGGPARLLGIKALAQVTQQEQVENKLLAACKAGTLGKEALVYPRYYVNTLLYAAPGLQSTVNYGQGSTTGTKTEVTSTQLVGAEVETAGNVEVTATFSAGAKNGTSFEVTKEASSVLSLDSKSDVFSHDDDTFFLWINPCLTVTELGAKKYAMVLTSKDNARMQLVTLTVAELKDPTTIPADKQKLLTAFTTADYQSILALDPVAGGAAPDPNRFAPVDTLQLDGPDHATDGVTGQGLDVSYAETNASIKGVQKTSHISVLFGGDVSFLFVETGVHAGITWDFTNEDTTETSAGAKQSAQVTLKTPTVGLHQVVDVYEDTMFSSFMFVPHADASATSDNAPLTGVVKDRSGKPLAASVVTLLLSNGKNRRVTTNAAGIYRVYGIEKGDVKVTAAGISKTIAIDATSKSQLDFQTP